MVFVIDSDEMLHPEDKEHLRTAAGIFADQDIVLQILKINRIGNLRNDPMLADRMFRVKYGFTWKYRVHEQVVNGNSNTLMCARAVGIRLLHDGYDSDVIGDYSFKIKRNVDLLRKEIKDRSIEPQVYFF